MSQRIALTVLLLAVLSVPVALAGGAAEKGSAFISGQLGVNYLLGDNACLLVNFSPRALYFPVEGLGVGIDGNLGLSSAENVSSTQLAIGPRVAYFLKMNRSRYPHACCATPLFGVGSYWMPFAGASVMYLMESSKFGDYDPINRNGYRARLGIGAAPMIGDRGTMLFELGFQTQSLSNPEVGINASTSTNQIYLEAGFGAFLFDSRD